MRRAAIAAAIVLAAGLAAWSWRTPIAPPPATPETTTPAPPPAWAPGDGPIVAWSGQAAARFEPCGCVAGMFGGLNRRAPLLARFPAARLLALELGGWSGGSRPHERLRTAWYLRGLAAAGIDAIAVGRAEVALGADVLGQYLRDAQVAGVPVVACNLQHPGLAELVEVTAGGVRFAVTAVVPADAGGEGLTVGDPADALAGLLPRLAGRPLVVVADLDEAGLMQLAGTVPGLALVVGGAVKNHSLVPAAAGAARVVHAGNHGKVAAWWPWGAEACTVELIPDSLPEDQRMRELLAGYQKELGGARLDIDQGAAAPPGHGFAGSAACTACHAQAARIHASSRHPAALAAVQRKGYGDDPDCLRCHVTGIAEAGGWRRQPDRGHLGEVGCEACHGPSAQHVADPKQRTRPVSIATCLGCHDAENSPGFEHAAYWPRIIHGR